MADKIIAEIPKQVKRVPLAHPWTRGRRSALPKDLLLHYRNLLFKKKVNEDNHYPIDRGLRLKKGKRVEHTTQVLLQLFLMFTAAKCLERSLSASGSLR